MRKSRILTSQNHPQTLPKRLQNRCSKKHRFFRGFLLQFLYICYLGNLENINFPLGKSLFLRISLKACFYNFCLFFLQKIDQKPFQNEVRELEKSMPKTCFLLTSIVSRSSLDFGGSLASKLEPNWSSWTPRTLPKASKIQSFGYILPRCFPRVPKVAPKGSQGGSRGRFLKDF